MKITLCMCVHCAWQKSHAAGWLGRTVPGLDSSYPGRRFKGLRSPSLDRQLGMTVVNNVAYFHPCSLQDNKVIRLLKT